MHPPYMFCISDEPYFLQKVKTEYFPHTAKVSIVWGNETLPDAFWNMLSIKPLFSYERALYIRHTEQIAKEDWEQIEYFLAQHDATLFILFCCEKKLPNYIAQGMLYKNAEKNIWVKQTTPLTRSTLQKIIQQYCKKHTILLEKEALTFLTQSMPLSTTALYTTLETLALAAKDTPLCKEDIKNICPYTEEYAIWEIVLTIFSGEPILHLLPSIDKLSFFQLSAVVQKELLLYASLLNNEIPSIPPYVLQKKQKNLHLFSFDTVQKSMHILLTAELHIKQGLLQEKEALHITVAALQKIYARTT